ncbi:hypothetical protein [Nocardia sp. NPDC057030]|uniref:hypothetical protein n=1 Tax=unclassified Nocardia TaxID=2637762 RepID=UPI00363B5963
MAGPSEVVLGSRTRESAQPYRWAYGQLGGVLSGGALVSSGLGTRWGRRNRVAGKEGANTLVRTVPTFGAGES